MVVAHLVHARSNEVGREPAGAYPIRQASNPNHKGMTIDHQNIHLCPFAGVLRVPGGRWDRSRLGG